MRRGRPPGPVGRRARRRGRLALVFAGLLIAGCAPIGPDSGSTLPQNALNPAGPFAREPDSLWDLTFAIAVVVFVLVEGLILFAVFRFRDRGEDDLPEQVHGNTRLEIMWTLIPAVILVLIAIPTVRTIFNLSGPPAADALIVEVVGKQYWWEFSYVDRGIVTAGELHIPTDREIFLELNGDAEGADVLHSFWIPRLGGKQDYVPGARRTLKIQADEPGTYPGQCAEFCGLSHANMKMAVIAHEPAEFDAWVADQAETPPVPTEGEAAQGAEIAGQQCVGCHAIAGNPGNADVRIAPNLTNFADRERFAGYILDRTPENLREWITNPQAVKPGAQMPAFGVGDQALTSEQIGALIAYLQTLD